MITSLPLNTVSCWLPANVTVRDKSCAWFNEHIVLGPVDDHISVALLGVPFDYAVNFRPGSRFGPNSIRESLASQTLYVTDRRQDLSGISIVDFGNVDISHDLKTSYYNIQTVIKNIRPDLLTIIMGGDHSITRSLISGFISREPRRIGLISFDAHFDSRVPIPGKEHSGHWLLQIQQDHPTYLFSENISIIGLSAGSYSPAYQQAIDDSGGLTFTVSECRKLGVEEIMMRCIEHSSANNDLELYVTVDIDVINQAYAPGTSVPNPLGLYPDFLYDALYILGKSGRLKVLDVVEVNPLTDLNGITSSIAAQAILQALAGVNTFISQRK
ncbi:agmatinase family protein [Paenibacillus macerans]|uniref:agmatinase family protein n=1 Tax=Paenibacillus macerans TaxID=44252 RepID=UPI002E203FCE|nr:agmatinase family protein [Paenibacillus macerans]